MRLHTNRGDIVLKLFPDECPKTVENFTTHARNGYYDNVIFHRVIKNFMIQTGARRSLIRVVCYILSHEDLYVTDGCVAGQRILTILTIRLSPRWYPV